MGEMGNEHTRARHGNLQNKRHGRHLYPALLAALTCLMALSACTLPGAQAGAAGHGTPGSATPTVTRTLIEPITTLDQRITQTVDYTLAHMTLDQKIGQMMMFETDAQSWNSDMDEMVSQMDAGAIIIYKKNMVNPEQLTAFIASAQAHSAIPMFVTMDEEGGNVDRLGDLGFNPPLPSAVYLGSTGDPHKAYDAGTTAALELQHYGINVDLAPVVDVRLVSGQVEGPRLFGNDPTTVASFAGNFLQALQQHKIIGTLKHWPGIGDTTADPHLTLPVINRTRTQLESTEFAPFRTLLADKPGMIMVTHVILPAIDSKMPASLSPAVVQGVLRNEMGYDGVVITDNLWMQGVSDTYGLGQAAVLAILAGDDLLEGAWDPTELRIMIDAVKKAVTSGQISVSRIDQSVRRLLKLKAQYGILPLHATHTP